MTDEVFDLLVRAHALIWLAAFKAASAGAPELAYDCDWMHGLLAAVVEDGQAERNERRAAEAAYNAQVWSADGYGPLAFSKPAGGVK